MTSDEIGVTENIFTGVFTTLVEAVHVQLSDERVDISVSEIFWEDVVLEVIYLFDCELLPVGHPMYDSFIFFVL